MTTLISDSTYRELLCYARRIARSSDMGDELLHSNLHRAIESGKLSQLAAENRVAIYMRAAMYRDVNLPNSPFNKRIKIRDGKPIDSMATHPTDAVTGRLTNEQLYIAVRRLPELEREVITLWAIDGFKIQELSEATGITTEDIYAIIRSAKDKLRKWLTRESL